MNPTVVFGTLAALLIQSAATAGQYGLRVFRDRDEWLAEATEAMRFGSEDFNSMTPQEIANNSSLHTGIRGLRLSTFLGARMAIREGAVPGNLDGTNFVDVSLFDSTPWIELRLTGGAFAWAAEFSGTTDSGGLGAQFGDALLNFGQYFEENEGGFLGFVTSSMFHDVRLVAGYEGEEFSFDNVEWLNIPAPGSAAWVASGAALGLTGRRRRARRPTLPA